MTFNICLDIPRLMSAVLSGSELAERGNKWLTSMCDPFTPTCAPEDIQKEAIALGEACGDDSKTMPGGPAGLLLALMQDYVHMKEVLCSKTVK